MSEGRQIYPPAQKAVVLLNGRNFSWASEMSGMSVEELEILYLEAKHKGILCTVNVVVHNLEHLHVYKWNDNLEMMVCDCGRPIPTADNKPTWGPG